VLSDKNLLRKYEKAIKEANVGPSGVAQFMATFQKVVPQNEYVIKNLFVLKDILIETKNPVTKVSEIKMLNLKGKSKK
jgi:hypothetical protein